MEAWEWEACQLKDVWDVRMLASDLSPVWWGWGCALHPYLLSRLGQRLQDLEYALCPHCLHCPLHPLTPSWHHFPSCSSTSTFPVLIKRLSVSWGEGELSEGSFCARKLESSAPLLTGWMASPPKVQGNPVSPTGKWAQQAPYFCFTEAVRMEWGWV